MHVTIPEHKKEYGMHATQHSVFTICTCTYMYRISKTLTMSSFQCSELCFSIFVAPQAHPTDATVRRHRESHVADWPHCDDVLVFEVVAFVRWELLRREDSLPLDVVCRSLVARVAACPENRSQLKLWRAIVLVGCETVIDLQWSRSRESFPWNGSCRFQSETSSCLQNACTWFGDNLSQFFLGNW